MLNEFYPTETLQAFKRGNKKYQVMLLNLALNLKREKEEITVSRRLLKYKTYFSSLSLVKHLKHMKYTNHLIANSNLKILNQ